MRAVRVLGRAQFKIRFDEFRRLRREVFNWKYGRKRTIECCVDRERADGDW